MLVYVARRRNGRSRGLSQPLLLYISRFVSFRQSFAHPSPVRFILFLGNRYEMWTRFCLRVLSASFCLKPLAEASSWRSEYALRLSRQTCKWLTVSRRASRKFDVGDRTLFFAGAGCIGHSRFRDLMDE